MQENVHKKFIEFLSANHYDTDGIMYDIDGDIDMSQSNIFTELLKHTDSTEIATQTIQKINNFSQEKTNQYFFGKRFYYWKYFNYKDGVDVQNQRYAEVSFDIPKYKNLKQEILKNKFINLSLSQWNNTIIKSQYKLNRFKNDVNTADFIWERVYEINRNSQITLRHIVSLLLYTNYINLSVAFRNSFKQSPSIQSKNDDVLKQKHSEFAIWGKLLRECIEVYGNGLWNTNKNIKFYHILNTQMLFNEFSLRLCIPTSATTGITSN